MRNSETDEVDVLLSELADLQAEFAMIARKKNCGTGKGGFQSGNQCAAGVGSFDRWFGDSKVVNADGSPKVVYHGTLQEFDAFSADFDDGHSIFGPGFYFAENLDFAEGYTFGQRMEYTTDAPSKEVRRLAGEIKRTLKEQRKHTESWRHPLLDMDISKANWISWFGANDDDLKFLHLFADQNNIPQSIIKERPVGGVMPAYLSVENPFDADRDTVMLDIGNGIEEVKYSDARYVVPFSVIRDAIVAEGHDGITAIERGETTDDSRVWVAFEPE